LQLYWGELVAARCAFIIYVPNHALVLPASLRVRADYMPAAACCLYCCCRQAILNIISNPVNSTVPIAAEALKKMGVYDKRKVMGVTTLDVVRDSACEVHGVKQHT
jgi:hypothetical protein